MYSINWLAFITEPDRVYSAVWTESILGAFAKLRWATISCVMSVCPSVRLSAWITSAPTGLFFGDIWYLSIFRKSIEEIQDSLKYDNYKWYCISGVFNAWPAELSAVARGPFWKNNYKRDEIKSNFNNARWPLSYTAVFWIVRSFLNLQRMLCIWYFTNM